MDPSHYDKIADKLMQFRGKLPSNDDLSDDYARYCSNVLKIKIDNLLKNIDEIAILDAQGWIR